MILKRHIHTGILDSRERQRDNIIDPQGQEKIKNLDLGVYME